MQTPRSWLAEIGAKGGARNTPAQLAARKKNAQAMVAARKAKRKAAK